MKKCMKMDENFLIINWTNNFSNGSIPYESNHQETIYEEAESYSAKPSTHQKSSMKKEREEDSEEERDLNIEEVKSDVDSQLMKNTNAEMEKVFKQIEYEYVDESIKQK